MRFTPTDHVTFAPTSLVDLLEYQASIAPEKDVYVYLEDGEQQEVRLTYAELSRRARAIGTWLQSRAMPGERVLLLYPPGLDYIAAFFGCLYGGMVAVPAYPPRLNRPAPRIQIIVDDAQATMALTTTAIFTDIERRFEHAPDLQAVQWLNTDEIPTGIEWHFQDPGVAGHTLAFLQYTSGSTSMPKGVMVSHGNLLHNLLQIQHGFQLDSDTRALIWLPSYHDMGLIGGLLEPVYVGGTSIVMSPFAFLQRPVRWLQAISRYKTNVSGGPNFAYDLCLERVKPEQIAELDLSCWRVAFSGAEPVRMDTMHRFAEVFASCGFQKKAFYPCYGLAEATLFVSGGWGPAEPRSITVRRDALECDRVEEAVVGEEGSITLVNCGQAGPDQKIVIVNPQTLTHCTPDEIGEIWIKGPSVAGGYRNRPDETRQTFQAYLTDSGEGPFLRTGDLGFMREGELFVTGRLKDLIIIRGSNHYPQDIELTVERCHPALQPGSGAAFSIMENDLEQLVVVQEVTRQARNSDLEGVFRAVRNAVSEAHELQLYAIVLVRPLSIPKTSSGKIQRHACKAAFLDGSLEVVGEWRSRQPVL